MVCRVHACNRVCMGRILKYRAKLDVYNIAFGVRSLPEVIILGIQSRFVSVFRFVVYVS